MWTQYASHGPTKHIATCKGIAKEEQSLILCTMHDLLQPELQEWANDNAMSVRQIHDVLTKFTH